MKKYTVIPICLLFILALSCNGKKDSIDIDTSTNYVKLKIDGQWQTYQDEPGGFLGATNIGSGNNRSMNFVFSAKANENRESVYFHFTVTPIKYSKDSLPVAPYYQYDPGAFEYRTQNKAVIAVGTVTLEPEGKYVFKELQLLDTSGKFTGIIKMDASYVNDDRKTVKITECVFNVPRNYPPN